MPPELVPDPCAVMRGKLLAILQSKSAPDAKGEEAAQVVVEHLLERGRFYFHADLRDFDSAMFFDRERGRLERVKADAFLGWLSGWTAINRASSAFKFIARAVETEALSGGSTSGIVPESFWASRPEAVYLSNGDAKAVRVTARGVEVVDNGTDGVLFAVGKTLEPWSLTEPADPFEVCDVFRGVQAAAAHGADLLRCWVYSLPTSPKSKPPLCASGDVGSGKTRLLKGVAELYGLPFVACKVEETAEGDFWPNMNEGGILVLDNADTRCKWLPDALAAAATDGCAKRRKLYSNAETVTLQARAWLAITTANPTFASDAGLTDRLQLLRMRRREGETSDGILTEQVKAARNRGLSHIAQAIHRALADDVPVPSGLNSRHPDFAAFAVRIGRALGREQETIAALRIAETDKAVFCVENDPVASAILALVNREGRLEGKASEIGERLKEADPELEWASSSKRMSKRLTALWPHLEKVCRARKDTVGGGFTRYSFQAGDLPVSSVTLDPLFFQNPSFA